ncbi:hypothetical protein AAGW04_07010 [Pectobacterium aroidearum]|uniref:hypothetical protein n=1 Tax=Pectobacterium aroidearum TaxID=1201031 RepID=UPI0031597B60
MKSDFTYTAMRVKQFGHAPVVEVVCFEERTKTKTECLLVFNKLDDVLYFGADLFHPLVKAEMKNVAIDAIKVGKGKAQIEAKQRVSELESSQKRQASRAKQFLDAVSGWSRELLSLNEDVRHGLDTPTIRSRLSTMALSMEKFNPRK